MINHDKNPQTKAIQSVVRAANILEFLAGNGNLAGLTTISKGIGLSKSTTYGLIATLEQLGYVQQNQKTGEYTLGIKLFELGQIVHSSMDVRAIARPYLEELVQEYEETAHLAILSQGEVIYIDKVDGNRSIRIMSQIGGRNPAHCTGVGKVLLAGLADHELEKVLQKNNFKQYTPNTVTEPEVLREHLCLVREQGYALDLGEIETGLTCAAAPVKNHSGKVIAAISLSGPEARISAEVILEIAKKVVEAGKKISRQFGWHG